MASTWHERDVGDVSARRPGDSPSAALGATFSRSTARLRGASLVGEAIDSLLTWRERARARRVLAGLSDQMLHDIGATRADAEREYRKPFWRT